MSKNFESKIIEWLVQLIRSDFHWIGQIFLLGLRFAWRSKAVLSENRPEPSPLPTGPFAATRSDRTGDLLLWVPRWIDSILIDDFTGGFGYSHTSIDTGEVDLPTGKPVMVEVTLHQTVERKFLDEYKMRAFARIPISKIGVDRKTFVNCVKSMLGESYDTVETLTYGEVDDPAKQMCSSLVSDCLPESVRREIAGARRKGVLPHTAVSVLSPSTVQPTKIFVSPNGYALFFGAPKGKNINQPDVLVKPQPMSTSTQSLLQHPASRAALMLFSVGLCAASLVIFLVFSPKKSNNF